MEDKKKSKRPILIVLVILVVALVVLLVQKGCPPIPVPADQTGPKVEANKAEPTKVEPLKLEPKVDVQMIDPPAAGH